MAATPYTFTATVAKKNGQTNSFSFTVSDVAAAFAVWPDGTSTTNKFSSDDVVIQDIIVSATTGDTTKLTMYINGQVTPIDIFRASNVATVLGRQVQQLRPAIPAGANVSFKQG